MLIYIDDILFGDTNESLCKEFENYMHKEFEVSIMEELTLFLGLQTKQEKYDIFIRQTKYTKELFKKFDLEYMSSGPTQMNTTTKLNKDEHEKDVDIKKYQGMIGSLLYLMASKPNIMFSVCLCVHFQAIPRKLHLCAIIHIFRYIKGIIDLGLWYFQTTLPVA
jgi:hypothetical protein